MKNTSSRSASATPQYLLLGQITRPHGVKGELRMRVLTDYPERISKLQAIYTAADPEATNPTPHVVRHVRMHQDYALLTLSDVIDRNSADTLRNLFVLVDIREAVPLEDDEVYLFQLIGMSVITETGEVIGIITEVLETGANDVYVVASERYGEVLIPVTDDTILNTNTDLRQVTVRLPEGLLPD